MRDESTRGRGGGRRARGAGAGDAGREDESTGKGTGGEPASELDALYTTPPSRFVARREELALAARSAGRAEDARRVRAARRPSLAAWAANLLLRSEPAESARFLELGRALREAYGTLDGAGIKELSVQRRLVVAELTRQAARLALEAGERLSGAVQREIESTLHAVLADPQAAEQWTAGRLERALAPPSEFTPGPAASAGARPRPARSTAPPAAERARAKDELAERRREKQRLLGEARKAAQAAERRLRDERRRGADVDAELDRAHDRHDEARRQAAAAEERLRQAREELRRADQERREAEQRSQEAEKALGRAEREARETAEAVDRLSAR
ncbi:hypothetical protein ABZ330_13720 [Streptomyces sp. NPDC006172]|uniref:hypothetical protein n=1 Tax=Streptomyces sp. NPDC006172 TaxID=3154470 RepID=UPI0033C6ECE3